MAERKNLNRDMIVDAALRIVNSDGPAALTARHVAAALDVRPAALHRHFDSMEVLTDAVLERVVSDIAVPDPCGDAKADMRALVWAYVGALTAYPNTIPLLTGRRFGSFGALPVLEAIFAVLRAAKLSPPEIAAAFRILGYFVNGALVSWAAKRSAGSQPDFLMEHPELLQAHPLVAEVLPHLQPEALERIIEEGMDAILNLVLPRPASRR